MTWRSTRNQTAGRPTTSTGSTARTTGCCRSAAAQSSNSLSCRGRWRGTRRPRSSTTGRSSRPRKTGVGGAAWSVRWRSTWVTGTALGGAAARRVGALAQHLVDRYGLAEVADWGFEVWNDPNLEVFWTSSRSEYFRLYDEAAAAIKAVDVRLKVGGPATAAAGWIADFASHVIHSGVPADFLATHTYGNLPLDVAATAMDVGLGPKPVWWTEWGVSPRHFAPVNDSVLGGPFVLHGMFSAMDRAEHLAYWVVSDHFEELGRPPRLLHGGFGLLTVGNLRKTRYWALRMLEMRGPDRLVVDVGGDGAESLVQAIATSSPEGAVQALVWNGTLDQRKQDGNTLLDRRVTLRFTLLGATRYRVDHSRLDREHSNIVRHWPSASSPDWPDPAGWARLREADRLDAFASPSLVAAERGEFVLEFPLPMPGVSFIRLVPEA